MFQLSAAASHLFSSFTKVVPKLPLMVLPSGFLGIAIMTTHGDGTVVKRCGVFASTGKSKFLESFGIVLLNGFSTNQYASS